MCVCVCVCVSLDIMQSIVAAHSLQQAYCIREDAGDLLTDVYFERLTILQYAQQPFAWHCTIVVPDCR